MDISAALAPKSDQLDAADLIGSPPRIFTITDVRENGSELADQQPVNVTLAEFPRVWRPSKGMLRVLADNWGKDVSVWVGRRVELYGDPNVYFGKEKRGGTRISRISHIDAKKTTLVNPRGGKGAYWSVDPLPAAPSEPTPQELAEQLVAALADCTTEAEIREWGNRAHARGLLDVQVRAQTVKSHVTEALAVLEQDDDARAAAIKAQAEGA